MTVYYNEIDPYCCAWLRNLIAEGLIPHGEVDDRDIRTVDACDLYGFVQCHFFAGIGGWALALKLAGWPNDRPVWTGSCPCQPYSVAGKGQGADDPRDLWPEWFRLIRECRPSIIFGEQVDGAIGKGWLDRTADDVESQGYALGAAVLPACSVGAPHRRDRLWFVANSMPAQRRPINTARLGVARLDAIPQRQKGAGKPSASGEALADARSARLATPERETLRRAGWGQEGRAVAKCSWWAVEPGVGRVAHGVPGRVGKLRGLGNAIVPQVAAEFIRAAMT